MTVKKGDLEKVDNASSEMKVDYDETSDRKLLIAVDFGTTFSGVAWAQTRRVSRRCDDGYRVLTDANWVPA